MEAQIPRKNSVAGSRTGSGWRLLIWIHAMLLLGSGIFSLYAQQQGYRLSWFTLETGAGRSSNEFFAVSATGGQPDAGAMTNEDYQLTGGFWAAALRGTPIIPSPPGITNIVFGDTNILTAMPVGTFLPIAYQWRLNGINLLNETNATLTIVATNPAQAGAYTCILRSRSGVAITAPVELRFGFSPPLSSNNDYFSNRTEITLTNFFANNLGASLEPGESETRHGGKLGGSSVWYTWSTNANGIARFRTHGSAFDTLMAVYTGDSLETLNPVADDDDFGGYLTSEVRFNVTANTPYHIAIDGIGGREGTFVVSWDFRNTPNRLPWINPPQSRTIRSGQSWRFKAGTNGNDLPLTFQWYYNEQPVAGAVTSTLLASNVGFYHVAVTNTQGEGVESRRAALEFGPVGSSVSYDKLEDLIVAAGLRGEPGESGDSPALGAPMVAASTSGPELYDSVSAGVPDFHKFRYPDSNVVQRVCPLVSECAAIDQAAKYAVLIPNSDGVLVLDTYGSVTRSGAALDTVLTVYELANLTQLAGIATGTVDPCGYWIGCDDDSGTNHVSSLLRVPVKKNSYYLVEVDAAETGTVYLNWIESPADTPVEFSEGEIKLKAANANRQQYTTNYAWLRITNSAALFTLLTNTLEAELHLTGGLKQVDPVATYAVSVRVISTNRGVWELITQTNTLATLVKPIPLSADDSGFHMLLATNSNFRSFRIEAATGAHLTNWHEATFTGFPTNINPFVLTFPVNSNQFYRVKPQ